MRAPRITAGRVATALAVAVLVASGVGRLAFAQPNPQPVPGQPMPMPRPMPGMPPGHPGMPGGRPFPQPVPAPAAPHGDEHETHHAAEHEDPDAPPPPINWWRGMLAESGEHAHDDHPPSVVNQVLFRPAGMPPPFLASLLNFGLLVFLLVRFGKKPLGEALVKRKQGIMAEIETATRLKRDAQKRLRDYRGKVDNIDTTLDELKLDLATQGDVEKRRALADAEERRARMVRDAQFRVEQELKAARQMLLQEAVVSAVAAAEKLIQTKATPEDMDRLAEEYLGAVAGTARPGRGGAA